MTPLAAQIYRRATDQETKDLLCQFQWFDCQALVPLALHASESNFSIRATEFPKNLKLPAPLTWLEFVIEGFRTAAVLEERKNNECIKLSFYSGPDFKPYQEIDWFILNGKGIRSVVADNAELFSMFVEELLQIIMQPNLVTQVKHQGDKRIIREVKTRNGSIGKLLHWSQCKLRGGTIRQIHHSDQAGPEKPLHYVRKYYRPSRDEWIDGHWKGNPDIGIHLKWYTPCIPKTQN